MTSDVRTTGLTEFPSLVEMRLERSFRARTVSSRVGSALALWPPRVSPHRQAATPAIDPIRNAAANNRNPFLMPRCLLTSVRPQRRDRDVPRVHGPVLHLETPLPDFVDRRIDEQLQDEARHDSPDHWRDDALHHVGTGAQ